jgi:hypothetical protein
MKNILFVLLFLISCQGCKEVELKPFKFRLGDAVYIPEGFYKGCKGHITEGYRGETLNVYSVDLKCYNGSYSVEKNGMNFKEEDLIKDDTAT